MRALPGITLLTLVGLIPAGCAVEASVVRIQADPPTTEAVYSNQARRRLLITRFEPATQTCVGLQVAKGMDDGVPGIEVFLPSDWGVELAYRSLYPDACHESFPQGHRTETADSASGFVDWPAESEDLNGVPDVVSVELDLRFPSYPHVLVVSGDDLDVREVGP